MNNITIEYAPTIEDALARPLDHVLTISALGHTLSKVGSEVSLILTRDEARELAYALGYANECVHVSSDQ